MKLRFGLNQAEAFRRGIDCPKSTAIIEVDPATLPQEQRNAIADRLVGIDVCRIEVSGSLKRQRMIPDDCSHVHLMADGPEMSDLMKAIEADELSRR